MENKKVKFDSSLVPLILRGNKTSTWRMFDDKNLEEGDSLIFIDRGTDGEFGRAYITSVMDKRFGEIESSDFDGHEKYKTVKEMFDTYKSYYGDRVNNDTMVKIIKFKLINTNK